ncbi:MAG: hypothetical protein QXU31_05875 [Archaeoglobaceae archaeon]
MLNVVTLSIFEILLGIGWGIMISLYAYHIILRDLEEVYGILALITSLASVLSIFISGILYNHSGGKLLMPIAAISLSTALLTLSHADFLLISLLLGLSAGIHGVSSVLAASNLDGDYRRYSAVHSSHLLGFSIGSLLVFLTLTGVFLIPLVLAIVLAGIIYPKFISQSNKIAINSEVKGVPSLYLNIVIFTLLRRRNWDVGI